MDIGEASKRCNAVLSHLQRAVVADEAVLEDVLVGVLAGGHVLLEDVPGTGKTLTARSLAATLGLDFARIQFTPDLLPSDITGTYVYDEHEQSFDFRRGPIFANVVLADEINRAPPKTQAALLEAMEEEQVTVEGDTHRLPEPFFVLATQNPVEQEGTFELPEAQVDRFTIKTALGYPDRDGEVEILDRRLGRTTQTPDLDALLSPDGVRALRAACETVRVGDDVVEYIADLARATRDDHRVHAGVSPRGTQRLLEVSRARAIIGGHDFVTPTDVKRVAQSVLAHRLVLTSQATVENVDRHRIIADIVDGLVVPTIEEPA
ncbi:MoxR-like ATPase [Halarchaeum solikamskense]|uniref:AAA family ATPase n=1 Tax=Halarchaeum nitratireducens TaxID=489913 RepID=UPI001B3A8E5E|nr:MoxR family ATPase [Halarchaeum solikamskense]MBP2251097.1 MoxR-like ATPase [Halarchaeum solikamskense]